METELVGGADLVLLAVVVRLGFWLLGNYRAWRTEQANGGFGADVPAPIIEVIPASPPVADPPPPTGYQAPPMVRQWVDEERERQAAGRGWLPVPDVEGREWRYGQRG